VFFAPSKASKEKLENDKNIVLIDVRNRDEYSSEHLRGSKNIPLDELDNRFRKMPRNKDTVVYCQNGGRSIRAIRKLEVAGFTRLYHMHEGLRGWRKAGFPTRKKAISK